MTNTTNADLIAELREQWEHELHFETGELFRQAAAGLEALQAEVERLNKELGDLPEAQSDMLSEIKLMRAQLAKAHGLLLWTLYHHQGASSPVGQPIRRALGIGQHGRMTGEQIRAGSEAVAKVMTPLPDAADQILRVAATLEQAQPSQYGSHELQSLILAKLHQAQPERAPLSDAEIQQHWTSATIELCSHENCYKSGFKDAERSHGIKQGGQHD